MGSRQRRSRPISRCPESEIRHIGMCHPDRSAAKWRDLLFLRLASEQNAQTYRDAPQTLYPRNECPLSCIWPTSTLLAATTLSSTTSTSPSTPASTSPSLAPTAAASPPSSRPSPASATQSSCLKRRSASSVANAGTSQNSKNASAWSLPNSPAVPPSTPPGATPS